MKIELERTFLIKFLPKKLRSYPHVECIDIYVPASSRHPYLRIRKLGDIYEMTKKHPVKNDPSQQNENTIELSKEEFGDFNKIKGKRVHKIRYYVPYGKFKAEIDVFQDKLKGLVLVDFEFTSIKQKNSFMPPDYCLAEITHEEFTAGGMLAGKKYVNIAKLLKKYNFKKIV